MPARAGWPGNSNVLCGDDLREYRVLPGVAVEQAQVVGRRAHARAIQTRRGGGPGVGGAELAGQRVDLFQRRIHAAQLHRQRVRRVVTGMHQQPVQQLVDGVGAALVDADTGALRVGVLGGAADHLADADFVDRLHRDEHLDDAGRPVPAVRVLGGDHVAGIQVGDQPGLGGDVVWQRRSVRRDDHPAPAQARRRQRVWQERAAAVAQGRPSGTSDSSTAGGVVTRYGHDAVSGDATGSADATAKPPSVENPTINTVATTPSARLRRMSSHPSTRQITG